MLHGSVNVGDAEIFAICDIEADFPAGLRVAFPDVPEQEWPAFRRRYPDAFGAGEDVWYSHDHCYLVRSPGGTVLVDTGVGPMGPGVPGIHRSGGLMPTLERIGVGRNDVGTVVHTHMHFDHFGWNLTDEDGTYRPTFPKARHIVHRLDWEAFGSGVEGSDPLSAGMFQQRMRPLDAEGLVDVVDGPVDLGGGLEVVHAPGHTVGHVVVTVSSGDERVVLSGDVVNHPAQLAEPTWREVGDMDLDAAAATRRSLFGEGEGTALFAPSHFPQAFGRVTTEGGRYVWTPQVT